MRALLVGIDKHRVVGRLAVCFVAALCIGWVGVQVWADCTPQYTLTLEARSKTGKWGTGSPKGWTEGECIPFRLTIENKKDCANDECITIAYYETDTYGVEGITRFENSSPSFSGGACSGVSCPARSGCYHVNIALAAHTQTTATWCARLSDEAHDFSGPIQVRVSAPSGEKTVSINPNDIAPLCDLSVEIATPGELSCINPSVTLDATTTGGTAPLDYDWRDSSNQQVGTTEDIVVSDPDTYTLTVTDASDCVASDSVTVTEEPGGRPTAEFSADPTSCCAPLTVSFTDLSNPNGQPITAWSWSFGDGATSTAQNPSHVYDTPGSYSVSLTVTNACGSDTDTKTEYIQVGGPPTAEFSADPTSCCAPLTVDFTDLSDGNNKPIDSWSWSFGDGDTSTEQNPSHVYDTPGSYSVSLTVTNACGSDVETKTEYIQVGCDLDITKTADRDTARVGETITYEIELTNTGFVPLHDVSIDDPLIALTRLTDRPGNNDAVLDVGETWVFGGSYVVTEGDLCKALGNTVTASARDDCGATAGPVEDTAVVEIVAEGEISLTKEVLPPFDRKPYELGDFVVYEIEVANPGDIPLRNVRLDDSLLDLIVGPDGDTGIPGVLDPGETWIYTGYYNVGRADVVRGTIRNTATVTAEDPCGGSVRDTDEVTIDAWPGQPGGCGDYLIISEVAWAGTAADPRDEWIELRNLGLSDLELGRGTRDDLLTLDGWVLRWRKKHPVEPEDYVWKVVELEGTVGLPESDYDPCARSDTEDLEFVQGGAAPPYWRVTYTPEEWDDREDEYYLLERHQDDQTVTSHEADLLYDLEDSDWYELSDDGEIIQLLNPDGRVVDTANAENPELVGWPAGDAPTFATMERTNCIPQEVHVRDEDDNWHTNLGVLINGDDAERDALCATAFWPNSMIVDEAAEGHVAATQVAEVSPGTSLEVVAQWEEIPNLTSWWWVRVSRPATEDVIDGAGMVTGRLQADGCLLRIDTADLEPGRYHVWLVYGEGRAILIPIEVRA